ncbi:fasciclin-like arabinogalactan protein 21 [Phragmites australis]|uniref:fasciclin-like arabinogalactan protein 21 n=1 Tax=Phragmites australis TaxID=29695 RepID=UPI002D798C40|nr:fasciclin-like arabinogalactan protein 21 [Phragmites australis]
MAPLHVSLLLLVPLVLPLGTLLSAAASHHTSPASTPAHLHHHGHRHRSPTMTATARINTAPSMHQNHLESEESQSLLVLDHFTPVAQAPSGEEAMAAMGAAAMAADPTLLDPPQAPSPPPSFDPAADLASLAPPMPQAEALWSAPGMATPPPLDEPAATTTTFPLPNPYSAVASPPVPIQGSAAGFVASGDDQVLQQLARVLASLGYNEMASAAALLDDSPSVARWPGAITVFAAPDVFLHASCPECSRRHLLLEHIALGYFPYSELVAAPTVKLPSASVGFCLNVAAERGPFVIHHVSLYVDGVEVSHPELYNDGRYVVHGLHGFVPPLSHTSCHEGSHHHHRRHHLTARSATTSAATAASVVRIMIREAISRLRDGGFGFVALAMRVKFGELEKLTNLTVFALDDQAIFTGGGHGYFSSVHFHIVPGYRLTRADLLHLRPGTKLPTLAGEDQKLVITRGASSGSDEVLINYIPLKEPDVVINSRVAVHGIYVPFPRLHLANLAASVAVASAIQMNGTCGVGGPFGDDCASTAMTSATIPAAQGYGEGQ